jgi:short-subunit dehydrogenase involved in D-alanine esterification of teichoic acids
MHLAGNTVPIPGGASVIGLALATALVHESEVAICGHSGDKEAAVRPDLPSATAQVWPFRQAPTRSVEGRRSWRSELARVPRSLQCKHS